MKYGIVAAALALTVTGAFAGGSGGAGANSAPAPVAPVVAQSRAVRAVVHHVPLVDHSCLIQEWTCSFYKGPFQVGAGS